jgi:heme exporter protein B
VRAIWQPQPIPPSSLDGTFSLLTHPKAQSEKIPDPGTSVSTSPAIRLTKVAKVFGRFAALRDITCDFFQSKLYVIVGENGAGKSTLLRILAGLSTPTSGSIEIGTNHDARSVSNQIGYMGHASLLYDEMSGVENLTYFAALYGLEGLALCDDAMRSVGLDPKLSIPVRNYSQGMRQRLSLARAIVQDPTILLLDEPFSNVDPASSAQITQRLEKLAREGKTVIVVTHQPALLEGTADEFLTISAGRIVEKIDRQIGEKSLLTRAAPEPLVPGLLHLSALNLMKDLRLEWRAKDAFNAMAFFALLVVVIFSFSFDPSAEESRQMAGAIIWVGFLFASVVALNQSWARELRNQVLDAYRVSSASPGALFIGKAAGNFLFVALVEALVAPLFVAFYNLRSLGPTWQLAVVFLLGTWALVVNGTFFAALSLRTRNRELMLPLLLFPISIPAILSMVQATTGTLTAEFSPFLALKLLAGYDIVFTVAGLLLFDTVLNAE